MVRRRVLVIVAVAAVLALGSAFSLPAVMTLGRGSNAIVIDPGHGGIDGGAYIAGQVVEKDITLSVSLALRDALSDGTREIKLTRDHDVDLSPHGRSAGSGRYQQDLAGRLAVARRAGGALLVSIHANYCRDPRPHGPIVFYKPGSTASQRLAQCVHNALAQFGPQQPQPVPGQFYILRNSSVPAILVELGFISNANERALLKTSDYQARLAGAVARGIRTYLDGVARGDDRDSATDVAEAQLDNLADQPASVAAGVIPVYFPRRGEFALARSVSVEASLPVMAQTGSPPATELLARSVLARLLLGPEDGAQFAPAVPAGTTVLGVACHDSLLTVDLSADIAAVVGESDEYLTVYSLVNSLCGIPGVDCVQLLIEGQRVETLAGHVDIERPLTPLLDTVGSSGQ